MPCLGIASVYITLMCHQTTSNTCCISPASSFREIRNQVLFILGRTGSSRWRAFGLRLPGGNVNIFIFAHIIDTLGTTSGLEPATFGFHHSRWLCPATQITGTLGNMLSWGIRQAFKLFICIIYKFWSTLSTWATSLSFDPIHFQLQKRGSWLWTATNSDKSLWRRCSKRTTVWYSLDSRTHLLQTWTSYHSDGARRPGSHR